MLPSLLLAVPLLVAGADDHPLVRDRTGVRWRYPFAEARGVAAETHRLLMIKPVAFGTTKDGCW
jgi:hypothetical protein